MSRRRLALGVVLAIAIGVVALRYRDRGAAALAPAVDHARPAPRLAQGIEHRYRLDWSQEQTTQLGDQALHGELALSGRLAVRGYGVRGGNTLVGLRLADLTKHRVAVMERALVADRAAAAAQLENVEVLAEIDPSGAVVAVHVPADAPELAASLLPLLVVGLELRSDGTPDGEGWRAEGPAPFGTAITRYAARADGAITRTRERYTRVAIAPDGAADADVTSDATITVDGDGAWRAIDDVETVVADGLHARWELHLVLESTAGFTGGPPLLAGMVRRAPGVAVASAGAEAQIREGRIGELTATRVLSSLEAYGRGAAIADLHDFFWRAGGLLEADPALCGAVADAVVQGKIGAAALPFALDLLASAGTPAAQSGLRRVLDDTAIARRDDFPMLVQRLTLLDRPDDASLALAAGLVADRGAGSPVGGAAAYALGAMANRLAAEGRADDAGRWVAPLAEALASAPDAASRARLIGAIGNAGLDQHVAAVVRFSDDTDDDVRRSAASALRRSDRPAARAALLRLAGDADASVQSEALASLRDRVLTRADATTLAASLAAGVSPVAARDAVRLLAPHVAAPQIAATLEALAHAPTTPPEIRAEINRSLSGA